MYSRWHATPHLHRRPGRFIADFGMLLAGCQECSADVAVSGE